MSGLPVLLLAAAFNLAAQVSAEKEAALGKALSIEFSRSLSAVENPQAQDYLDRLAARLSGGNWHITVVKDDIGGSTHEATALPGGYLYVPVRLFTASQNEGEFVGMLAHTMAHVLNRDGLRTSARGQSANGASIPLVYMGGQSVPAGLRSQQRRREQDADARAASVMAHAGFNPARLLDYLTRTQAGADRVTALNLALQGLAFGTTPDVSDGEFERIRAGLVSTAVPNRRRPPSLIQK